MEIFKEKDESEVVKIALDPEGGITIDSPVELDTFNTETKQATSAKAKAFVESHKKTSKSELQEMDNYSLANSSQEELALSELQADFNETLISIDELMEFLDNNEEHIDV